MFLNKVYHSKTQNVNRQVKKYMDYLSVKETAEIKSCSERYIKKLCKDGKLEAVQQPHPQNKCMCYMIPVSALSEQEQAKYYKKIRQEAGLAPALLENTDKTAKKQCLNTVKKPFSEYSDKEREIITKWCKIFKEWQELRVKYQKKTEFDSDFVGKCRIEYPELEISIDILYRKYNAYVNNDYEGLIDHRGGWNKGNSSIDERVWKMYAGLYLSYQNPKVALCRRTVIAWCKTHYPELVAEIPSVDTFRRRTKKELDGVVASYIRDGKYKCFAKYGQFAERDYSDIEANDVWIFDNHTLDIISLSPEGKPHRLSITTIQDAKSGVIVSCNPCENPCSESTVLAIRQAQMNGFGIGNWFYFDNGREFLTLDVGGRGNRATAKSKGLPSPPTILQLLGAKMINAIPKNADAKNVERFFYTFKEWFSKSHKGYCGGTILERHEELNEKIRKGEIVTDTEIKESLEIFIKSYNSTLYGGKERKYKGMSRIDVWNESINSENAVFRDVASENELDLLLSRTTRYQLIKRNGVFINLYGRKIWFKNDDSIFHINRKVYVRYDPYNIESVRVYDAETDKYLWTYPRAEHLEVPYLAVDTAEGREKLEAFMKNTSIVQKTVKAKADEFLDSPYKIDYLAARLNEMQLNAENYEVKKPSRFQPITSQETNKDYPERSDITEVSYDLELMKLINNIAEGA